MNIAQIETNLQKLITTFDKEDFIYQLLLAYGLPKASITRLKKGNLNLSKVVGEISWKKKLFFKEEYKEDLHLTISEIVKNIKRKERFVIVTDYKTILAVDTKTDDKLDCALTDLAKHYDFFLPWAGMEKAQHANENPADVKAAEKMAKLFDEIKKDNPDDSPEFIHGLNVFLSRLLFCFFAEDTHIFEEENQFTNAIASHTQADGSDLNTYLDTFFTVLNTPESARTNLPEYLSAFPFVNGGLFKDKIPTPIFSRNSRNAILVSGEQDWSAINPDIFGSMFQAVISVDQRGSLGQHYTSVPNIMKVIEPLFLNDLYEDLEKAENNTKKLNALLNRIHKLKIFDPACGSGNFLIIAYKELRILEIKILKQLNKIRGTLGSGNLDFGNEFLSHIRLSQFYGIEIDDFAGEIAKLALWLAEHQMNVEFFKEFGRTNPTLPLKEAGKIVQGNATRLDWEVVCPKVEGDEIYILGNPPFIGFQNQKNIQKKDIIYVFNRAKNFKRIDYIGCWFNIASSYIKNTKGAFAFVSTNSISQGEQVGILWPIIYENELDISFAYQSFNWENNAKNKAKVTCIIVGVKPIIHIRDKFIYANNNKYKARNINPYLIDAKTVILKGRSNSLSGLNKVSIGNVPLDGNNFILNKSEYLEFLQSAPEAKEYLKFYMGASDFLKSTPRYCIWVTDENKEKAMQIQFIKDRIERCQKFRENGGIVARQHAHVSHRFRTQPHKETESIIFPKTSSSRREYIPAGYLNSKTIISEKALASYNAEPYLFGLLSSKMHMVWLSITSSRMRNDFQYSVKLTYNTFPFPKTSPQRKNEITQSVFRILEEREKYSGKTLAQLYDPDKMPEGLREAHRLNDLIIEKCYRSTPFKSDEERLEYLFKLYEKMIAEEKEQGTLFAKEKKTRKKKTLKTK